MKAILLSFPFINFCESGFFSELRPIQIKNFPLPAETRSGCKKAVQGTRKAAPQRSQGIYADQIRHQGMILPARSA
jgi:hypothetical protein